MSEFTYFLDLGKNPTVQMINDRLNNADVTLRRFPENGYEILRSSTITEYNNAEFNVQTQRLETETGSDVDTSDKVGSDVESVFLTGPGKTSWTNSSVAMKYTKYSTGRFDAEFNINLSGSRTAGYADVNNIYYQYFFAIPVSLIRDAVEDSVSIESYTGVYICQFHWRKSKKWYTSKQTGEGVKKYIRINPASTTSEGNINITDCKIYLTGYYDLKLNNA